MKKNIYFLAITICLHLASLPFGEIGGASLNAQNISINGTGAIADPSAILDVSSPTLGLLVPRVTLTAINATTPITNPTLSLLVFNTATASSGTNAVTPGYYYWDGTKWVRFITGSTNNWALLGNAGTVDGTNFIGTTDNIPFNIRVNNQKAGRIDNILRNAFYGLQAGVGTSSGTDNTAIGHGALINNNGTNNTAIGKSALGNAGPSNYNTAVGNGALGNNSGGSENTAIGAGASGNNTSGNYNTAIGKGSLANNTSGNYNTVAGYGSMNGASGGDENISIGHNAMMGYVTGLNNIAVGTQALYGNNSNANYNIGIGYNAGSSITTGNKNIFLGYNADAAAVNYSNAVAIGNNAIVGANNVMVLGGTGSNTINVGINTATPTEKLEVQGSVKIVDGTQGVGKVLTSDASGKGTWQNSSSLLPTIFEFGPNFTITNPGAAGITTTVGPVFSWVAPVSGKVLITFNKIPPYVFSGTNGNLGFGFTVNGSGNNMSFITAVYRFAGGDVVFAPATEAFNVTAGSTYSIQAYYFTQSMTSCMFNYRGNSSGPERFLIQYIN